jgi:hypothetical protein
MIANATSGAGHADARPPRGGARARAVGGCTSLALCGAGDMLNQP